MSKLLPIQARQLKLGMYLHGMDCNWLDSPYWRNRFLITKPAVLEQLQSYGELACWIDLERGVGPDAEEVGVAEPAAAEMPLAAGTGNDPLAQAALMRQRAAEASARLFSELRFGKTFDGKAMAELVADVTRASLSSPDSALALLRLKSKDEYTHLHSVAVCALMANLARTMGMDAAGIEAAATAGLLHDIGKVVVPLEVLNKPGKLTDAEYAIVRRHPVASYALLKGAAGVSDEVRLACLYHHEKMDGTGYPKRLSGAELSTLARMCAICDVYDAITSNRPYKEGWDPAASVAHMMSWKGHFDPAILSLFVRSIGIYPAGALVRLHSARLAIVIRQNQKDLTRPLVGLLYDCKQHTRCAGELDLLGTSDAIEGAEDREHWHQLDIDAYWSRYLVAPCR